MELPGGRPAPASICTGRARGRPWMGEQFPRMQAALRTACCVGAGRDYLCVLMLLIKLIARLLCLVSLRKCSPLLSACTFTQSR